jgi:hypothetical protein
MTQTDNETQIIVEQDVPMVTIVREFDVAPEKVFRTHADRLHRSAARLASARGAPGAAAMRTHGGASRRR